MVIYSYRSGDTMFINTLLQTTDSGSLHSPAFRVMLEDHLDVIREKHIQRHLLPDTAAHQMYPGDLYGFLVANSVPRDTHWIIMRVNGMQSPSEFRSDHAVISLVDPMAIVNLYQTFLSRRGSL